MKVDYDQLARELVRALRGSRSQVQLSRRLGFTTNAIYSWEAGRRWPTAARFFHIATRTGHELPATLAPFYKLRPTWLDADPGSPEWVVAFLSDLRGSTSIQTLAERAGVSRFTLSRWLSGRAEPRLPGLLALIDAATDRLLDFVALFVSPSSLPATRAAWRRVEAARELAWASPWAQVVWLSLELEDYRALPVHDDAWLALRLGLDVDTVRDSLERLHAAGQVRWDGARFRPAEILTVDLRRGRSGSELKAHWAGVGRDRIDAAEGMVSYNLFTVSAEVLGEIRELQRAHYRAVRRLIEGASHADRVVLMNLQLLPLDRPGSSSEGSGSDLD